MQGFTVQRETFRLSVELLAGNLEQSVWRQLEAAAGISPFCG